MDSKFSDFLGVSYTFQGPNIDVKLCGIICANGKSWFTTVAVFRDAPHKLILTHFSWINYSDLIKWG
jgi:hypothetical protein